MIGHWAQAWAAYNRAAESINPEGPKEEDEEPKKVEKTAKKITNPVLLLAPISCPPAISFYTLPEHYIWVDWIKGKPGYRFGRNRVPSGTFDDAQTITASGWVDVSYQMEGIKYKISVVPRSKANGFPLGPNRPNLDEIVADSGPSKHVIKLDVWAERPEELDTMLPKFLDFPVAAIRSPPIRVEANNLIRISVLVKRPFASPQGTGGIFVRDSIGGEQFQCRTNLALGSFNRVVLFRKAPADGTFTVTLGLAGYAEAYFDDFRVEVIEHAATATDSDVAQRQPRGRTTATPNLPDPDAAGGDGELDRLPATPALNPRRLRTPHCVQTNWPGERHPLSPALNIELTQQTRSDHGCAHPAKNQRHHEHDQEYEKQNLGKTRRGSSDPAKT